jgi:hypothetical protein
MPMFGLEIPMFGLQMPAFGLEMPIFGLEPGSQAQRADTLNAGVTKSPGNGAPTVFLRPERPTV